MAAGDYSRADRARVRAYVEASIEFATAYRALNKAAGRVVVTRDDPRRTRYDHAFSRVLQSIDGLKSVDGIERYLEQSEISVPDGDNKPIIEFDMRKAETVLRNATDDAGHKEREILRQYGFPVKKISNLKERLLHDAQVNIVKKGVK